MPVCLYSFWLLDETVLFLQDDCEYSNISCEVHASNKGQQTVPVEAHHGQVAAYPPAAYHLECYGEGKRSLVWPVNRPCILLGNWLWTYLQYPGHTDAGRRVLMAKA